VGEALAGYHYLGFSLKMLAIALLIGWCWRHYGSAQEVRAHWLAFLLCAPFGLFSFEFIPKYWDPQLLWWFGPASIEDIIFSASTGAIGWFAAAWPLRWRLRHGMLDDVECSGQQPHWLRLLRRFVFGAAPGILVAYAIGLGVSGTEVMTATLWGIVCGGLLLLWRMRSLWQLGLLGGLAFGIAYCAFVKLIFTLWPDFMQAWGIAHQPHVWVWGIPLYEGLWAIAFGAVWPLFVSLCLGTKLLSSQTVQPH
jgi:uncharacterized membrane-anchored protein